MKKLLLAVAAIVGMSAPVAAQTLTPPSTAQIAATAPAPAPVPVAVPTPAPTIVGASTGHYFRLMDPHHPQMTAATLYDLRGIAPISYVTELAIITHSTADGTIIPGKLQALGIAPEDWDPLHVGFGGSAKITGGRLQGNALVDFGTSFNACPLLLSWAVKDIGTSAPLPLQVVKAAVVGNATVYPKLRLGYVFQGNAISGGVFQSAKEMFPGSGILNIANNSGRFEAALGWTF